MAAQRVGQLEIRPPLVVAGIQHAHRREKRHPMASLSVEPPENQDSPSGNVFQTPCGDLNPRAPGERKRDSLPEHDVPVVLRARKLGQRQLAVVVPDRSLGPGAT